MLFGRPGRWGNGPVSLQYMHKIMGDDTLQVAILNVGGSKGAGAAAMNGDVEPRMQEPIEGETG